MIGRIQNQRYNNKHIDRKAGNSMCGRYYVDDDTAREIEKLIRQVDEKMRKAENTETEDGF